MQEAGLSYRTIAHRVGRNVATVLRCCRAWFKEGRHQRVRGTGPRRRTTDRQDRHLRFLALRSIFDNSRGSKCLVPRSRKAKSQLPMSSIYRRIKSFGIRSYRPHLVLPLTPNHRRQRLAWCSERIAWDEQWNSVIFSDESRFCLSIHDGRYIRRVNNALFQQDNARPHIANVSIDFLDDSQVDLLPWLPRSPDLSPIEHVWDLMGRRLTNLHNPPLTLAALRHEIQVGWNSVPQDEINHLIRSMPRRVRECIGSRSGPTHC
jgi:hypothetical protein